MPRHLDAVNAHTLLPRWAAGVPGTPSKPTLSISGSTLTVSFSRCGSLRHAAVAGCWRGAVACLDLFNNLRPPHSCRVAPLTATRYEYKIAGAAQSTQLEPGAITWSGDAGTFTIQGVGAGGYAVTVSACNGNGCATSEPSSEAVVGEMGGSVPLSQAPPSACPVGAH